MHGRSDRELQDETQDETHEPFSPLLTIIVSLVVLSNKRGLNPRSVCLVRVRELTVAQKRLNSIYQLDLKAGRKLMSITIILLQTVMLFFLLSVTTTAAHTWKSPRSRSPL